jgi:hypothetical protein
MTTEQVQRRVIPAYATNVAIEAEIKANQKNKQEREAHIRLVFFDNKTKFTVSEVILSRLTAIELEIALKDILKKVNSTLKKKDLPKKSQVKTKTPEKPEYMG